MNNEQLFRVIDSSEVITTDITNIILELDETNSVTTQASLNSMLLSLRERVSNTSNKIKIQAIESKEIAVSLEELDNWIRNNIGTYSSNLYFNSLKKKGEH